MVSLPCTQCWPSLSLALLASVGRTVPLSSWSGSRFFQRVLRPPLVPDTHRPSKPVSTSYTPPSEKGPEWVPGVGVPSVSQTMPGDMVHSPVDFAEFLQVPLFVSCRPQGLGLASGWFQDKHLFLPLVEGQVGVLGRDMPTLTLTRLENPGPRGPAFPRPALPASGSPRRVPCCPQGLGRLGFSRSRQAVRPPRKPQHRLPCPACPGLRSPALCSQLALSLPRALLSWDATAPKPPKAGAREGVRLGSDRCGALGLSPPLDSSGEPRSSPASPPRSCCAQPGQRC